MGVVGAPHVSVPAVVISGPVGVGKTSVGCELSELLCLRGVMHTFVDFDALTQTFPRPRDDRFGTRLGLANLAALWGNARAAGSRNLIIARVIENDSELADIGAVVPGARMQLVRLEAPAAVLVRRVAQREPGSARDWHVQRALQLARSLPHGPVARCVVDAHRPLGEIAAEVAAAVDWMA